MKFLKSYTPAISTFFLGLVIGALASTLCLNGPHLTSINAVHKDAPKVGLIAKVNGREYTEDEVLEKGDMELIEAELKVYSVKYKKVKELLVKVLIGEEAKKSGMEIESFISDVIVKEKDTPTDEEVNKFIAEKKIPEKQINETIFNRIKIHLGKEKREKIISDYVSKLTKNNPVDLYFKKPTVKVEIEKGSSPSWGSSSAPVHLVLFSDFECPYCNRAATALDDVKSKLGENGVFIVFKHYPLPMHKQAPDAHEAAACAQQVGGDSGFWKFHDLVFKGEFGLSRGNMEKYASKSGLDVKKFNACMESGSAKDSVSSDLRQGSKLNVKGTPTLFINGQPYKGPITLSAITDRLETMYSE